MPTPACRAIAPPSLRRLAGAACVLLATALPSMAAVAMHAWRFDPVHSQVWFSADHQGFSHPLGRVRIAGGWFRFDPDDWRTAEVQVTLDMASADLGDARWNEAVRGAPFLATGDWPEARFVSQSVEPAGDRGGVIHGTLTLRGVARPVDVAFTLNRIGNDPYAFGRKAGFSARATLRRSDFGMTRFREVVGAEVHLRLEIEGIRDDDAATQPAGGAAWH